MTLLCINKIKNFRSEKTSGDPVQLQFIVYVDTVQIFESCS